MLWVTSYVVSERNGLARVHTVRVPQPRGVGGVMPEMVDGAADFIVPGLPCITKFGFYFGLAEVFDPARSAA